MTCFLAVQIQNACMNFNGGMKSCPSASEPPGFVP